MSFEVGSTKHGHWMHLVSPRTGLTWCMGREAVPFTESDLQRMHEAGVAVRVSCHRCISSGNEQPFMGVHDA